MYAVIETGGKQIKVAKGESVLVEKLDVKEGDTVTFDKVLMVNGVVGKPYVNATVTADVVKHGKAKKVKVYKYTPKKKYRKTQGHRQPYTKVEIKSIKNND